jgi:hypothetical protein
MCFTSITERPAKPTFEFFEQLLDTLQPVSMREFLQNSIERANQLEDNNMSQISDKLKFIQRKEELKKLLLVIHNEYLDNIHRSIAEELTHTTQLNNNQVNQAAYLWDYQCQRNFWRHWKDDWAVLTYAGIPKETYPHPYYSQDEYSRPLTPHQLAMLDNSNPHNILRHEQDYTVDFTPNYDGWADLRERAIIQTTHLYRRFANCPILLISHLKENEDLWESTHRPLTPTTDKK